MKAIKTLLAVSALAAVGVANAATVATFTYDDSFTTYKQKLNGQPDTATYGTGDFNGTGSLDSSGVLTITASNYFLPTGTSVHQYDVTGDTIVITGTISGGTFNLASYTTTPGTCTNTTAGGCAAVAGSSGTLTGAVALSGLTTFSTPKTKVGANPAWNADTYTFVGSPVPVPAAAWLFGSGLLGLAGTARRRRSV